MTADLIKAAKRNRVNWKRMFQGILTGPLLQYAIKIMEDGEELNDEKVDSVLILANSYTRFSLFLRLRKVLSGAMYWNALGRAYTCSDNLYQYRNEVRQAFASKEMNREALMNATEQEAYSELPEVVTIYRGMSEIELKSKDFGASWSLKREVAEYFCHTYDRNHATRGIPRCVHSQIVKQGDIIALFNGREEFEVIYIMGSGEKTQNHKINVTQN